MNVLRKQFAALICLALGFHALGASATAGTIGAMAQMNVPASVLIADEYRLPVIKVAGASAAKRAAERAAGGRAVSVVRSGGNFVVTVVTGGSAKRCVVDANSGRVRGCR
jgi:hypothetical protein